MDVFGVALRQRVFARADLHQLVGSTLGRRFPDLIEGYAALRLEAEERARSASIADGGPALAVATISDHLEQILSRTRRSESAEVIARCAIDRELELEQIIARADPEALMLQEQAHERGIAIAMISDSYLPRDLIARMLSDAQFEPDHLLVASNEGVTKQTGLFERLLKVSRANPEHVTHVGCDRSQDVDQPGRLGIASIYSPRATDATRSLFELGLIARSGVDSIALTLADTRFHQRGPLHSRPEDIGYYAGGPLASGFAAWIGQQIDSRRPEQVLFCGPSGDLIRRVTTMLRPDIPRHLLTTFQPVGPGACPFGHLDGLDHAVSANDGSRVLVVESGLDGLCHPLVQYWAQRSRRSLHVTGAYLGLREPDVRGDSIGWAFEGRPRCAVEQHLSRRPEIIEALIRSFPSSAKDLPRPLRSFMTTGRQVEAGVLSFAEDFEPWVRLDHTDVTSALVEPALRVISNPTPAEAATLGEYPGWNAANPDRPQPLAIAPRRFRIVRRPRHATGRKAGALWSEGFQALVGKG